MSEITVGAKVRMTPSNLHEPGVLVYTVEVIEGESAIIREPKIPGLSGGTRAEHTSRLTLA